MTISWTRQGERRVHVYLNRPGYTRLLYKFEALPEATDAQIAEEVACRDMLTGVRLATR